MELPELAEVLIEENLDISITGFAAVEIDQLATDFEEESSDPADSGDPKWLVSDPVSEPDDGVSAAIAFVAETRVSPTPSSA